MNTNYDIFLKNIQKYTLIFTPACEYNKLLNVIFEYSKLDIDWDGYNAIPPSILTCINAYNFTTFIQMNKLSTPSIMLSSRGEISFFWNFGTIYIEANFENNEFSFIVVNDKKLIYSYDNTVLT